MKGKTMQKDKRKVANPDAKKSKSDYQSGKTTSSSNDVSPFAKKNK